ncbi:uncharacterized protein BO96DRAFT_334432 [Aspergillus niger CBS 101883]|uniref:Contig An07c0200, genomic contig n=2 Tax=Aspergillus niger TaxID=5061 RepID=A2QNV2_ASPNC|nr:uncharacterized protein BO96DRAFT_334432 [Aspergillus niger CBS 101883]XP_059600999.1 uncharacterized protein An07g07120 [Aspergillus niger]PYH57665.1 hypothetical protein BO96DRAFT_334432 [Aspergillus niger CBS 101883]CAK39554.1 unnamed protein product [Aspergillus niger]
MVQLMLTFDGEKQQQMMDRTMGRKPFTEGSQQGPRLGTYQGMPQENCCLFGGCWHNATGRNSRPVIVWAVVPPGNDERSSSCGRVSVTGKKRRGKGAKNDCPPTQKKIKAGLWIKKQVPCDEGGEGRGARSTTTRLEPVSPDGRHHSSKQQQQQQHKQQPITILDAVKVDTQQPHLASGLECASWAPKARKSDARFIPTAACQSHPIPASSSMLSSSSFPSSPSSILVVASNQSGSDTATRGWRTVMKINWGESRSSPIPHWGPLRRSQGATGKAANDSWSRNKPTEAVKRWSVQPQQKPEVRLGIKYAGENSDSRKNFNPYTGQTIAELVATGVRPAGEVHGSRRKMRMAIQQGPLSGIEPMRNR